MAEVLDNYTFTGGGMGKIYPWDLWLNGHPWKLESGVDFGCAPRSMSTLTHTTAKARGIKVRTALEEDGKYVIIQAIGPRPETPATEPQDVVTETEDVPTETEDVPKSLDERLADLGLTAESDTPGE